ncbi:MAG TPA: hypothetical protein DDY35_03445, partial [Acidimicrobiaceae bacterium]|nr:hypothetical protein [Acidimicrobiaceae bacterium]
IGVGTVWAKEPPKPTEPDPVAAQIAERTKRLFDPSGRLNPGRRAGA